MQQVLYLDLEKGRKLRGEELRNRSVIFVEHTPGGELAKLIRNQLTRMEELMGFKIKVVERAGTALKDLFSPTNIWRGEHVPGKTVQPVPRGEKTYLIVQGGT